MPLRTWNGSSFNTAKSARVWNGSSWVNAKSVKVWNGSSWVNFLSSVNIEDASEVATDVGVDNAYAEAGYTLYNDGTAETYNFSGGTTFNNPLTGQWLTGGLASDFSVRATATLETGVTGGTFNTWQSLSTTRSWSVGISAFGNDDGQTGELYMTIDIAYTADTSTIIDTAFIQLTANAFTI